MKPRSPETLPHMSLFLLQLRDGLRKHCVDMRLRLRQSRKNLTEPHERIVV